MAPKIRKSEINDRDDAISKAKIAAQKSASDSINFSFKYLVEQSDKFPCFHAECEYYYEIVRRIKAVCTMKVLELFANRSKTLRMHPIEWIETSEEKFGIPGEEQIVDTPYQISLTANEYGRLHGFFIYNTFYIVWFDKNHALYPRK